ncbi:MAG: hypothetical protein KF752_05375 [Pirellulaceae bacterium]|nr:hypothetical protein [Pirellulaceae bacterium]
MSAEKIFETLDMLRAQETPAQVLQALAQHLEGQGQFHELFEALKMKLRLDMGWPVATAEQEQPADEEAEARFERGLIEVCRQVGEAFVRAGKIREGWMYLRPVGDRQYAATVLSEVQPTDENYEDLINVLLHEAVDVRRGYQLALQRMGTCNSITMFEQSLAPRPRADQQAAAELLVRHVHGELLANLKYDIQRREGSQPVELTAEAILQARPDLLKDGAYHLDTSHLASTVRFARVIDDPQVLQLALDIAQYGRKLHPQYQYPGEEPFLDLYPASIAFFRALLGQQVDAGIRYFAHKADTVDQQQYGVIAVEVLVDLLSRCGRHAEAITQLAERMPPGSRSFGIAPSLLQLSQRLGDYRLMRELTKQRGDLLGYTAALLSEHAN